MFIIDKEWKGNVKAGKLGDIAPSILNDGLNNTCSNDWKYPNLKNTSMKKIIKKILLVLFILLVLIQLYPKAKKNNHPSIANDITQIHTVPDSIQVILKTSCYDCHSNNTYYPWYSNLQPVSFWLNDHIEEGKKELNFSEFATYRLARQYRKLEEIIKQVKEDEMPLQSYTIIHRDAVLSTTKVSGVQLVNFVA